MTQERANAYFHCGPRDRPIGTPRMVTARELVVLSGSSMSNSKSVKRHRHLRGSATHERHTVSSVEDQELNLHKPLPKRASNPGR